MALRAIYFMSIILGDPVEGILPNREKMHAGNNNMSFILILESRLSWQTILLKHCKIAMIVMSLFYCSLKLLDNEYIKAIQITWLGSVSLIWSRQYFVLKTEIIHQWPKLSTLLIWWDGFTVGGDWTHHINFFRRPSVDTEGTPDAANFSRWVLTAKCPQNNKKTI